MAIVSCVPGSVSVPSPAEAGRPLIQSGWLWLVRLLNASEDHDGCADAVAGSVTKPATTRTSAILLFP